MKHPQSLAASATERSSSPSSSPASSPSPSWNEFLSGPAISYVPPRQNPSTSSDPHSSPCDDYWDKELLDQWQQLHDGENTSSSLTRGVRHLTYGSLLLLASSLAEKIAARLALAPRDSTAPHQLLCSHRETDGRNSNSVRIGVALPEGPFLPLFVLAIHSLNLAVAEDWLDTKSRRSEDRDATIPSERRFERCRGVVFVPMESDEAPDRLRHILEDSRPDIVLVAPGEDLERMELAVLSFRTELVDFTQLVREALNSLVSLPSPSTCNNQHSSSVMEEVFPLQARDDCIDSLRYPHAIPNTWDVSRLVAVGALRLATSFAFSPPANPSNSSRNDIPSHIVYTSGTTGKPKGCLSSLWSLQHYIRAKNMAHGILRPNHSNGRPATTTTTTTRRRIGTVVLLASAVTFDPCFSDVLATLVANATLGLATRERLHGRVTHDDDDDEDDGEEDSNKSEKEGEDHEIESPSVEPFVPSHEQRDTKRVLFSKEEHDDEIAGNQIHPKSAHDCEPLLEQLHEHREHQAIVHGSDRSEFENPFALNEEENNAAANVVLSFDDDTVKGSGKRVLKGRVLFVRIGKKISKVKSRGKNVLQQVFVLRPFGKSKNGEVRQGVNGSEGASEMHEDQVVLTIPENPSLPHSPSSVSVASISSSVLTGGTNTKRNLGAVPVYSVPKAENPYGTINYNRISTESTTNGSDALPPPLEGKSFPVVPSSGSNDDDAISLLAAAIAASQDARVAKDENTNEKKLVEKTEVVEEAKEMEQEDESSVFLVVTPDDGGPTEAFQVVSSIDGITPVRDIDEITGEHSEIRPSNLSCIFACNSQGSQGAASIQIMDAAAGGIDLTPTAVNPNFASVFRNGPPASVAPTNGEVSNLLPSIAAESDDEEEETLLHDGCTVIHQASTFGDHTIATTTTAPPQAADDDKEQKFISSDDTYASIREQVINESRAIAARVGSFEFSPDPKPSLCRQAAKNGSFLFSPDNMGRAGPRIRARERLALKQGNVAPSITMLPAADKTTKLEQSSKLAIVEKRSYSSEVSSEENEREAMIVMEPAIEIKKSEADSESLDVGRSRSSIEVEVQKKAVMSSVTEPRLFSFKSTLSKFDLYAEGSESSTPVSEGDSPVADEEIEDSPTVEKVSTPRADDQSKKTYPTTPFPENMPQKETIDSPKLTVAFPNSVLSPTNSTSSKASSGRKKSPRTKTIPKSALKTKRGLVKERVSDIQQRLEGLSAVTGVNGRLKRNHSYRLRSPRRLTNGEGKLAPRKPVLQNPMFIRSVPIGIAKSYSHDESDNIPHYVEQKNSFDKATIAADVIREKEEEQYDDHADLYSDEGDTNLHYSSKYLITSANAIGVISPTNLERESHSPVQSLLDCDSSSFVSEATEYDAFNALLGKLNDCGSSSSEGSDNSHAVEKTLFGSAQTDKENAEANNVQPLSSDEFLPFKQDGLVRPTEINQHDKRPALTTMTTRDLQLSPLQRTPIQARKWRTMAAAAAQNKSGSVRFK
mmetsp:Transcript_7124/g.14353  ORF Transcript_7124/g.14353 Transcript_7124/m.14353 type:complete len:1499 (+) Transcript_7124:59-4555(+)